MEYFPFGDAYPVAFQIAIVLAVGFCALGIFRLWVISAERVGSWRF